MAYYSSDDDLAGVMASRFVDDTGAPSEVVPFTGTEE
jgi:hypothetical protein